jgi:predicted Zn-dependent protease
LARPILKTNGNVDDSQAGKAGDLEDRLAEASRMVEDGDEQEAFDLLLELERDNAEDPVLLCMLGTLADHLGADGMAVDFFRRCLAQDPADPQILVAAGAGLAGSGDPAAEPALRLAAVTAPGLPLARMQYGAYLSRVGLVPQALEELLAARSLDPDDARIRRELGIAFLLNNQVAEALEELESAAASDPEDADLRLLFGLVLIADGDTARAAEELFPLAETLSEDSEAQVLFALLFAHENWEDEGWLALSRAESAADRADPAVVQELEEALETGEEAVRPLLEEFAASALRLRISTA